MKTKLFIAGMLLCAVTALAKDIKTAVFTTQPVMHCESCENRIKNNLRFEKGIKKIETDIPNQAVTITYDADKTNVDAIIAGFKKIEYTATVKQQGCCEKQQKPCCQKQGTCAKADSTCQKQQKPCCKMQKATCAKANGACQKQQKPCCKMQKGTCAKANGSCPKAKVVSEGATPCCTQAETKK